MCHKKQMLSQKAVIHYIIYIFFDNSINHINYLP